MRQVIRLKLADSLSFEIPAMTPRRARIPDIRGKAHAIIGMRRAGKTYFLYQCMRQRLNLGQPRDSLVYFNFEDERLAGMEAAQLSWILEEYFARFPEWRERETVTFLLDEIQVVPGWETFVRRILDTEKVDVYVSGSSARLLSREIATSLRGRATETIVFPFGFAEYLQHCQVELPKDPAFVAKRPLSMVESSFRRYLLSGGFPEALELSERDRVDMLQGYVDTVVFRDVAERHQVTNLPALRALVRQLLASPAGRFSIHRCHNDFRSQGLHVSKDSLHQMLSHLEDAFLVRLVSLATSSERQRQSNPRKIYPGDHGLAAAFDRSGKANQGAYLETTVAIELERRGWETGYANTESGYEIDFVARDLEGNAWLIQVCADLSEQRVVEREVRALLEGQRTYPRALCLLLTTSMADCLMASSTLPQGIRVLPTWQWLLQG